MTGRRGRGTALGATAFLGGGRGLGRHKARLGRLTDVLRGRHLHADGHETNGVFLAHDSTL